MATAHEPTSVSGPRSNKGARTRARLVDAAREIFEEQGFFDARIADIAERAGLASHGAFYHYFDSKEEVFREVATAVYARITVGLAEISAPASTGTPYEHLRNAMRSYLESYRRHARIMAIIELVSRYDESIRAADITRFKRYNNEVAASIRDLQRRGLADDSLDPRIAALALGMMTARFAEVWLAQGALRLSIDRAVDELSAVFANGIGMARDGSS